MKIAIIGAGAIGGLVGAKLALAGEHVTFIVRGANLEAIRDNGIKLVDHDGSEQVARNVTATNDYAEAGVQDIVVLAMKAHQVEAVVDELPKLIGPHTLIVTMQNGMPFWYFHGMAARSPAARCKSVDPSGRIARGRSRRAQIIGCVVYPASELVAPGVVKHIEGDRFPLGELDGSTQRARAAHRRLLRQAPASRAPVLDDIRAEIWLKLWGNLTFNPISALTHATLVDICQFPLTRELAAAMMPEAQAVADKLGIDLPRRIDKRIAGAEKVGKHKTSMLQDIEAGRAPEIDALVGSVVELGRLTDTPTPHIDTVYALVKLLAKTMDEEKGRVQMSAL